MHLHSNLSVVLIAGLCLISFSSVSAFRWWGTNAYGQEVVRTFNVIDSPPTNPHTFDARLVQSSTTEHRRFQDAIEFYFTTNWLPSLGLRHFAHAGDVIEKRAARHGLRKLIEYTEGSNGTAGFEPGVDNIVQNYYLWAQTWTELKVTFTTNSGDNKTYSICTHSADGVVTICLYLTSVVSQLTVNGSAFHLDPNDFKFTIDINNFPYLKPGQSRLALKVHFDAHTRVVDYNQTDASAMNSTEDALDLSDEGDDVRPVFAMDKFVNVTGTGCSSSAPVTRYIIMQNESIYDVDDISTDYTDDIELTLVRRFTYFSFLTNQGCDAANIYWDPDFGVSDNGSYSSGFISSLPSVSLILAVVGLVLGLHM